MVIKLLGSVKNENILEIGCGNGYFSRLLAKRGAKVTGLDRSSKMIDLAQEEEKKHPSTPRFPGSSSQHLWVMESSGTSTYNRIDEVDLNGNYIPNPNLTGAGSPNGTFSYLRAMALDSSGNIYIADQQNVEKFSSSGTYLAQFGSYGSGLGQYQYPTAGGVDKAFGDVFVLDQNDRIERYSASGTYPTTIGSPGTSTGQLSPSSYGGGVAVAASGYIWVADYANNRVEEFGPSGNYIKTVTAANGGLPSFNPAAIVIQ